MSNDSEWVDRRLRPAEAEEFERLQTVGRSFLVGCMILISLWMAATTVMLLAHNPVGLLALLALLFVPTSLGYVALTLRDWL